MAQTKKELEIQVVELREALEHKDATIGELSYIILTISDMLYKKDGSLPNTEVYKQTKSWLHAMYLKGYRALHEYGLKNIAHDIQREKRAQHAQ